jgi:hypothetical protein
MEAAVSRKRTAALLLVKQLLFIKPHGLRMTAIFSMLSEK